ncbi:MAG: DUF1549 domain-containing protein [Chthonomonadales bacterium]
MRYFAAVLLLTTVSGSALADLKALPGKCVLTGLMAFQRVVVEEQAGGRFTADLSAKSKFTSSNPAVATVGAEGVIHPVSDGSATIHATNNGRSTDCAVTVVGTKVASSWSFKNHVLPVFTRSACNSGACHGAAAGKGGLRLTLRGFDPLADYNSLTRQAFGRRVVIGDPNSSLVLKKPSMQIGHGGGERLKKGSADYLVVADWIRSGAPKPKETDLNLKSLDVFPENCSLKPGDGQQILVRGTYSDGHTEDVTRWVKFGSTDSRVAVVDENGHVNVTGQGEASVTVWFSSKVAYARVTSPFSTATQAAKSAERFNRIDDLVLAKLESLGIAPSPICTDREFIRRAFLDSIGILPTPMEVDAFLADTRKEKRNLLINSLLERPEFVDYWTYKWSDLLLLSSRKLSGPALTSFYDWIKKAVQENRPWDQFAREILLATGSNLDNGAANYYLLHKDAVDAMETTTQAFMGISMMCARCHNHPLEKWTQRDYYQMANLFSRVRLKNGDRSGEVLALASTEGNINHPRLNYPLPPKPLDGVEMGLDDTTDRRKLVADWLTSKSNPYFARNLTNRVWKNFMGRGIVELEDDLRLTNPPSNSELLDWLSNNFAENGSNVKELIRLIMQSASYQRSAEPTGNNGKDERYFSHYIVRRLPAEALLDAMSQVTAIPTDFAGYPRGTRALQLKDSQISSYFLTAFGRPERAQTCSCERASEPNVAQALHLANGDTMNMKLKATGGMIDRLLDSGMADDAIINSIFRTAYSRDPNPSELRKVSGMLKVTGWNALSTGASRRNQRRQAMEDLLWAVMSDQEFLFNH